MAMFELPTPYEPDGPMADFLLSLLGTELASDEPDFVADSGTRTYGGKASPVGVAWVEVKAAEDADRGEEYLRETATAVVTKLTQATKSARRKNVLDKLLESYRNRELGTFVTRIERLGNRGMVFADYLHFEGTSQFVIGDLKRLQAISTDRVIALGHRMLPVRRVVKIVPDDSVELADRRSPVEYAGQGAHDLRWHMPVDPAEAHRKLAVSESRWSRRVAAMRAFQLDNGLRVVLYPETDLPVVDIRLVFGSGTADEPAEVAGVAEMTAALLTPRFDDPLRDLFVLLDFFRMGGRFTHDVEPESTTFRVRGMAMYADMYLRALDKFVVKAGIAEVKKSSLREAVDEMMEDEDVRRSLRYVHELRRSVFGTRHPYTRSPVQTRESMERIDRKALTAFKKQHYTAGNAVLIVVGNYDLDLIERHVRHWFGSWSKKGSWQAPERVAAKRPAGAAYLGFEDAGESQVGLVVAFPSAGGVDRYFAARRVLREMLQHRLTKVVRDQLGASYGVSVRYVDGVGAGMLRIAAEVDPERAGEATRALLDELESIRAGEHLDEDFVVARRRVVRDLLADEGDSASIASELGFAFRHGLGLEFHDIQLRYVGELDVDKVEALIADELAADATTVVLSGPRSAVETAYAHAGIDGVRFVA